MRLRKTARSLFQPQTSSMAALLIPMTKARCWNRDSQRTITTTATRTGLRIPKTSKRTGDIMSLVDTKKPEPLISSPTDLWGSSLPSKEKVEGKALNHLVSSWIDPTPSPSFPFSRDASRNSSTTPREEQPTGASSELIMQATKKQASYGNQVNWGSLNTKPASSSVSANMIQKMTVIVKEKPIRQPMTLNPSSGRTVLVSERIDVAKAFKLMEQSCGRNRVRREANSQRFHERPGLKRKRLKRQGWRQRFLEGFKATVDRVQELRRQGW